MRNVINDFIFRELNYIKLMLEFTPVNGNVVFFLKKKETVSKGNFFLSVRNMKNYPL